MFIERNKYDKLPLAIQTGALLLWGTRISSYQYADQRCELYFFNDFFAEIRYNTNQQSTTVSTYLSYPD